MNSRRDVRIVASLFILEGLLAAFSAVREHRIELNAGLLWIPAGIGLLRFRSGWRTFALVSIWLTMIIATFGFIGVVSNQVVMNFGVIQSRSRVLAAALIAVSFAVAFWQYRVLTRSEVRHWFDQGVAHAG